MGHTSDSIGAAIDRDALKELRADWPAAERQFASRTGTWKSSIVGVTTSSVDQSAVNLRFDLLPADTYWSGPPQRDLILHITDLGFVQDEQYADRLSEAVLDFLDSESVRDEKRVR
jgi:hypothetical protein